MKTKTIMVAGLMALLAVVPMAKATIAVTDGDFESTTAKSEDITNWFDHNGSTPGNWWEGASEGNSPNPFPDRAVILGDLNPSGGDRWIYQAIGTKVDGETYELSLDYAQPTDGNANRVVGLTIEIFQGSFVGADGTDLTGLSSVYSVSTPTISDMSIHSFTNTLDLTSANTTDPLWLRISNVAGTGTSAGAWVEMDNVQIIPEPATLGLMGVFGAGIFFMRRCRII